MDNDQDQIIEVDQKTYEIGYLLSPFIPEEGVEEFVAKIFKTAIEANGGTLTTSPVPRMRKLAYPITIMQGHKRVGYTEAYFSALRFQALPEAAVKIKETLDKAPEILRFIMLAIPKNAGAMTLKMTGSVRVSTPTAPEETAPEVVPVEEKPELSEAEIDKQIEGLLTPNV